MTEQADHDEPRARILWADRDAPTPEQARRLLGAAYEVEAIPDPERALDAARDAPPDLVLAAVMTPEVDGVAWLARFRADPRLGAVPVIVLGAQADEEAAVRALRAGADDWVAAPFGARELAARVEAHLRRQRSRRAAEAALRASEAKFATAFGESPLALTVTSLEDGRLVEVNEAFVQLSGYGREEALGRSPDELGLWVEPTLRAQRFARLLAGERVPAIEASFRVKSGEVLTGVIGSAIVEIAGKPCVLSSVTDITARKRAEDQLARLAAELRLVTDAVPALISYVDAEGRYQLNNKAYEAWFGHAAEAIHGRHMREVLGDTAFAALRPHVEAALAGRRVQFHGEIPYRDGGARHIDAEYVPDVKPDGSVAGFFVFVTDVTQRHRAEQALRARERTQRLLADIGLLGARTGIEGGASPERLMQAIALKVGEELGVARCGFSRVDLDAGEIIVEGVHRGEPFARSVFRLADYAAYLLEDGLAGRTTVAADTASDPRTVDYEARYRPYGLRAFVNVPLHRDGRWVGNLWVNNPDPRQWTAGEVGLLETVAERLWLTVEQARAAVALRESEARFRTLVAIITDVPWVADAAGAFGAPQPAWEAYTGQPWAEHRGFGWMEAVHPDDRERMAARWRHASGTLTLYEAETRLWHARTQGWRHVRVRATPVVDPGGSVHQWIGACTDVEEQRRADRAKDEFLAMLGHELRNPLGAITSAVEVLGAAAQGPGAARAHAVVNRQLVHLTRLVDDLLDVARVTAGKIPLERRPLDLAAVVRRVVQTWRVSGRLDRHAVTVAAAAAWISADETRLEQVVGNLLANALKFTPEGGAVTLAVGTADGHAVLEVRDTGVGMSVDLAVRVFDLFVQGAQPADRARGGLGIGLTLVRRLVELHGGTVTAHSEGEGRGSVFMVRLPGAQASSAVSSPAAEALSGASLPVGGPAPGQPRRVLVIEDNDDGREMLRLLLECSGHTVFAAGSGEAGLALASAEAPDVAIVDIGLPGLDGYEVGRRLRTLAGPDLMLIALTGYGSSDVRDRTRDAGYDHHLLKPVEPARLREVLAARKRI